MMRLLIIVCVVGLFLGGLGVPTAFAEERDGYVVQPGDTMLKLAARFEVSVDQLASANGLNWNDWIFVGQRILIPDARSDESAAQQEQATMFIYSSDPRVPDPQPPLPVLALEQPESVVPFAYARVIQDNAPVFASPGDSAQGLPPKRILGAGYVWVSVEGKANVEGQEFYKINPDEFVPADALNFYNPSRFQGAALAQQPERPFAWILKPVQPVLTPGGAFNPEAPRYQRYDLVQIFATEHVDDQVWYLIGPHQWINQIFVGKVTPSAPPEGMDAAAPDTAWIEIDLFEQTLAAYEGDRMVYATLVSSGLRGWDTPPGLFQVWLRFGSRKMSGAYDRPDYYFLEDVPWTMYFNRDIALHTAYWHDGFGYRHSHGCVNLAPLDARWLYDWAPETTWVWVHSGNEITASALEEAADTREQTEDGHDS